MDCCYHCLNEADYEDVHCPDGQGLGHCVDCVSQCDLCDDLYCEVDTIALKDLNGLLLCESCLKTEEENKNKLAAKIIAAIEIPGYWYAGRQETDEATTLEFISSDDPKVLVQILRKSA